MSLLRDSFQKRWFSKKNPFEQKIRSINGFSAKDESLYTLALHQTANGQENNERLEFLGDAVLDAVIAEVLYKRFPEKEEGLLTQMKSELVKATSLNRLANCLGITPLVVTNLSQEEMEESKVPGSALEAWIGAIYMDRGYAMAKQFVGQKMINPYVDWSVVESQNTDYKSQLLQRVQQNGQNLITSFEQAEYKKGAGFLAIIQWGDITAKGLGRSKKIAEQRAAQKLLEQAR